MDRLKLYRSSRLRNRLDFAKVFQSGKFLSNRMFAVHLNPQKGDSALVGFTAGKRLGKAYVRNRCKRRMKECYRILQYDIPDGYDYIFVARQSVIVANWDHLLSAFRDLVRRVQMVVKKDSSQ